jgi:hypothetical protein
MKLVPKGSNKLVKVGKSIEITNKLITEIDSRKLERFELSEEQVGDVYIYIRREIMDRIKDSRLSKFDLDEIIKFVYQGVKEANPDDKRNTKALYYAQAIPDIFNLVNLDEEVSDYLVDNDFDFDDLAKMRKRFKDLNEVRKAIGN